MIKDLLSTNRKRLVTFWLIVIILVGGALRLYNLRWDLGTFPHPDERSTLLFYAPTIELPENMADLLNPHQSPLNPFWNVHTQERRSYTYGHFPLYLLVLTGNFLTDLTPLVDRLGASPEMVAFFREAATGRGYAVIGRALVGLLDTLSIYLVFLIARRLYGQGAGLLAATLSAFAVLHIQLAHFFAVDPVSTTFVLLAIYGSILMVDRRTVGPTILTGAAIGLAVSSKYSALPIVMAPAVAAWFIWQRPPAKTDDEPAADFSQVAYLLTVTAMVSFITFALTSPFVLLDYGNFYQSVVEEQGRMVSGVADFPFTRQYRHTISYVYFIEQQIRWGLGWPLGLLAFGSFAWVLVQAVRGKLAAGEWIILVWLIPYFGITGLFLAKFMRYMSPVTPLVIIFGVGMLVALRRFSRSLATGLAGLVLFGAIIWATMFVNGVYATEHTWVTASRWIYNNAPEGACIAVEHWEEGVPRDWAWLEPGMSPGYHGYAQPQLPMYDPDTEQKYQVIRDTLRNCDYLVIASNRMLRTLPRLSERYPMSTKYYESLFAGQLGYELAAQFETPPRLGPLVFDDQEADESFTVYDHPRAYVFKKGRELSDEEWFALLGNTWSGAVHGYVGKPTLLMKVRGGGEVPSLPLDDQAEGSTRLDKPLNQWPVVADWSWNTLANQNWPAAVVVWWLAVQVIGLITFPITFLLLGKLADGGYLLSKSLGLLLVSYGAWILAGIGLPANRLGVIIGILVILAVISFVVARRRLADLWAWWQARWPFLFIGEGVFALVFLLFVSFRLANPDLWQPWNGGEKMLEIGFLHAIVKSATMPPYDPFFAGTYINYYYYGLFIVGVLIKLTGLMPTIAFNLAVPMLAALTAVNVFSLSASLTDLKKKQSLWVRVSVGLLTVLIVVFFSNLDGMGQFLRNLAEISDSSFSSAIPGLETLVRGIIGFGHALGGVPIKEYNYWDPSRVIPNTINEFPYWSFLFADLHPHMIGIPFTVLFLSLVYVWLRNDHRNKIRPQRGELEGKLNPGVVAGEAVSPLANVAETGPPSFADELKVIAAARWADLTGQLSVGTVWRWLAFPFVLGALAVINTWDLPTYLGLLAAGFAISRYRASFHPLTLPGAMMLLAELIAFSGLVLAGVMLLYRPFFVHYQALDVGLGWIKDKIPLDQFFKLWGFFLLILFTWLWLELRRPHTRLALLRALALGVRRWNVSPHLVEIYRALVTRPGYQKALLWVAIVLGAALILAALGFYTMALLIPWLVIALLLLLRLETTPEQAFVELLVFTGLLLLLGVQLVFLKDFLGGGDYYRMNTYFKFFIQVWVLFGLAAGVMLAHLWGRSLNWPWGWRLLWQVAVFGLVFASLVFFVLGTRTRLDNRFTGARPTEATLDGMAYMTVGQFTWEGVTYDLKYDYEAIKWLQENVSGASIIAEAKVGYYREWGMRVAAYTGLPSILGGLHQSEQHFPAELGEGDGLVNQFWFAVDPGQALELIDRLNIEYIYFGQLERSLYGEGAMLKFNALADQGALNIVFQNEGTTIYQVMR
jgi:uncharacterized membrane protein